MQQHIQSESELTIHTLVIKWTLRNIIGPSYFLIVLSSAFWSPLCAGRFRQVEVLTAMANAFYSLYSHVSRTPLQKLAPPEFSLSSPNVERGIGQRFFGNIRNEPRSPVERLKDTVSKMCLYTGSRGSDSVSPNSSPRKRNSLPDVVGMVLGTVKNEGGMDQGRAAWLQGMANDIAHQTGDKKAQQTAEIKPAAKVTNPHKERIQRWSQSGHRDSSRAKACLFKFEHVPLESTHTQDPRNDTVIDEGSTSSTLLSGTLEEPVSTKPTVAIITHDVISPHVFECVHKAPYCSPQTDNVAAVGSHPVVHRETSCPRTLESKDTSAVTETQQQTGSSTGDEDGYLVKGRSEISQDDPESPSCTTLRRSPCRITVTGWEGDTTVPHRDPPEDLSPMCSTSTPQLSALGNLRYLRPIKPQTIQIKQANSFELEEVCNYLCFSLTNTTYGFLSEKNFICRVLNNAFTFFIFDLWWT